MRESGCHEASESDDVAEGNDSDKAAGRETTKRTMLSRICILRRRARGSVALTTTLTCLLLGTAASCSSNDATDSPHSAGGNTSAGHSAAVVAGAGGTSAPLGAGNGGMDSMQGDGGVGLVGGVYSVGGVDGVGGSGGEAAHLPGHAGTICDPKVSYGSPLPAPANRTATRLSASYFFTEGPVWVASGGYLLFSDFYNVEVAPYVPGAHVRRFTPPNTFDTFITDSGSNGLALSADGLTLFAARRIKDNVNDGEIASYSISTKAKATILGSPTNPNDLVARSDGNFYFSDGDVYRIDPNGDVTQAAQVAGQTANGVMLAPDERTLYTGWSDGSVYASALTSDGSAGTPAPFTALQADGHPDGMAVDCAGNLYAADYTNGTVQVFDGAGAYLGTIALPAPAASPAAAHATNVAFGGANHRTLFITAHRGEWNDPAIGELHSIDLNVPGLPY
jgi:gluconolactonase